MMKNQASKGGDRLADCRLGDVIITALLVLHARKTRDGKSSDNDIVFGKGARSHQC
ncbi:MAG: hypothetical protein AAGE59_01430 [Cyanobacteria bacterium P01_F01_bin.86]